MEIRKQFENKLEEYFKSEEYAKIKHYFKESKNGKEGHPTSKKYVGLLYWHSLELKEPVKFEGELVEKLYIMPYRIKQSDVDKAVSKKADGFPDYDWTRGNFHKLPDMELQILFVKSKFGGPGKMVEINKDEDENDEDKNNKDENENDEDKNNKDKIDEKYGEVDDSYKYKKNWRFPAIGSENENKKYSLEELMKETIKLLYTEN